MSRNLKPITLFAITFVLSVIINIIQTVITDLYAFESYYTLKDFASIKLQSNVQLDTRVADSLKKEVRILCWIETYPKNLREKAIHVARTWGKRCDKTLYVTTEAANDMDNELDLVVVNVTEGYEYLWAKTTHALKFIHDRYIDKYDWFFKADDDTYVIVENLRHFLLKHSPDKYLAYGCQLNQTDDNILYFSGGAGYVLSRAALKTLRNDGFSNEDLCPVHDDSLPEDVALGLCLKNLGVHLGDTRDQNGRLSFHVERAEFLLTTDKHTNFWFDEMYPHFYPQGFECCSHKPISFHYVKAEKMYLYDALLYNVWPYGIKHKEIEV